MLGHRRAAYGEPGSQFSDGLFAAGEHVKQAAPVRLRSYLQGV